jgi:RHS repeat-associated protein
MARDTYDKLKGFGQQRGCGCHGDPDWDVVRKFIDVGYDRATLLGAGGEYLRGVSDEQCTTALTDSKGALAERESYDAYGNSAGLMYYRARFYDLQLGRFISEDPIGLAGGINSFAYVSNNPQNKVDPSGLYDLDVHYYLTYYLAMKTGC